jgi:hypothetical protein
VGFRIRSADGKFLSTARRRYSTFLGGKGGVDVALTTVGGPLGKRKDEPVVRRDRDGLHLERHDFAVVLREARAWAVVDRTATALDGLLRIVLAGELLRRGGFLCHSAAVGGWLFPGRSGAGKSTLGRKVPRGRLLADELVGFAAGKLHSTPFWGDFRAGRENGSRRLEAIFLLDRRAARGVRPVSKQEALGRLLECALCFEDDPASAARVLRVARSCVEAAPAFVLSYDARRTSFRRLEAMLKEALR